jgi:hypothetical protein
VKQHVLILGASYGSLFSTKLLLAGHRVSLVCTGPTAELINREGTVVRFPVKGRESLLDVASKQLPGSLSATTPDEVDPSQFDLVVLGMQEAQYGSPGVRELMGRVAKAGVPCLAIMNMPPLAYLKRIPALKTEMLEPCYADPRVWDGFDPALITLASPDPQAFRPPDSPKNVLQVGLPTNFKAARFEADDPTSLLRSLEADIEAARFDAGGQEIEIPVKLKVHESVFVPLAKWPMLITGNYRCIRRDDMIAIKDAVHANIDKSMEIYDWVWKLCAKLGADDADLVPFEKYAKAAEGLTRPSSAARALFGGAEHIERVDCLIRRIASQQGLQSDMLDEIVTLVDERLAKNRAATIRIQISGVAYVFGDDGQVVDDPSVLKTYDGYTYGDERFTDYLGGNEAEDALVKVLEPGGYLRFDYDGHSPCLIAITEFRAVRGLDESELRALIEYTAGQWSDGIGENLATTSGLRDGRSIQCQTDMPLEVRQFGLHP